MRICYYSWRFSPRIRDAIDAANEIITEYTKAGYRLTLRQLYYQFVARDLLPNTQRSYKNLGNWINEARLAGLVDWFAIEDRTRNLKQNNHWDDPADLLRWAADGYGFDTWKGQPERVEIWVEKEALAGVIERPGREWDVAWFCCRGYVSQSEMWRAARRLEGYREHGQEVTVIHLGDHDPSGVDMSRDIFDKLETFGSGFVQVERIALNMDQIEELKPPPAPAKRTDSRFEGYAEKHGTLSWELDALDPAYLDNLISETIEAHCDVDLLSLARGRQEDERRRLRKLSDTWEDMGND
jgi:hypothetical protein